jgi:hypothetical protein
MNKTEILISAGGGITSQFIILIQSLLNQSISTDKIYVNKGPYLKRLYVNFLNEPESEYFKLPNWWDAILDQSSDGIESKIEFDSVYEIPYHFFKNQKDIIDLPKYKFIVKKYLKFHPLLLESVSKWKQEFNIDENTLGVHLRLTDLNDVHSFELGKLTIDTYIDAIKNVLKLHPNINKIFVASEIYESIDILKQHFSIPILHVSTIERSSESINSTTSFLKDQIKLMKNPLYWRDVFLDVFLLSNCKYLLGRVSNIPNTAIILSDTIEKYYCLNYE